MSCGVLPALRTGTQLCVCSEPPRTSLEANRKWTAVSLAGVGTGGLETGCGEDLPLPSMHIGLCFSNFELDFFNEKGIFYVASVVSPLPWCVVCFRTVPVHPWPGHSPSSLQFCGCPGVCALWLFLQSSWWSGPLYFCMESRISLLVQQKGWLQR